MAIPSVTTAIGNVVDEDLRSDVEDELEWDPAVPSTSIAVSVTDHAVTLAGTVHLLAHRLAAVHAAQRIKGVHAIVDEIVVAPANAAGTSDEEIGIAVEHALESSTVPEGIRATVRDGVITLTGTVEHHYETSAATNRIRDIKGVTWVCNDIEVKAQAVEKVVRSRIVSALHRNADLDSRNIHVMAADHEIWLSGTTRSLAAKGHAEAAAWATPGVETVHNNIVVA